MIEAKEAWSFYRLSDGTTLRIKPVMIGVFRADGQQTADGEPVYSMKSTLITDVRAPATATPISYIPLCRVRKYSFRPRHALPPADWCPTPARTGLSRCRLGLRRP